MTGYRDHEHAERRTRPGLFGRLSFGHSLMIMAGLLAALVNFALLRSLDDTFLVAVADRDLVRGTTATADAFRFVEVRVGADVLSTLVEERDVAALDGRIVSRSVYRGDLLALSDFAEAAAPMEGRAMSVPVDRVHAAGGMISTADVVDVVAVVDGVAEYIVLAAPVLDVAPDGASGLGAGGQFYVTLAVDGLTALKIAGAMDAGSIEVIRSTGAVSPGQLVYPAATAVADGGESGAGG